MTTGFVVNGSNLKIDVVLIGSNNLAADTAGRDHFIAGSKSVNHLLVFFLTFLLRTDQKEPENGKNEDHYAERREHAFKSAGLRSSARGCLCICFRNKQFKTPTMRYGFTEGSGKFFDVHCLGLLRISPVSSSPVMVPFASQKNAKGNPGAPRPFFKPCILLSFS